MIAKVRPVTVYELYTLDDNVEQVLTTFKNEADARLLADALNEKNEEYIFKPLTARAKAALEEVGRLFYYFGRQREKWPKDGALGESSKFTGDEWKSFGKVRDMFFHECSQESLRSAREYMNLMDKCFKAFDEIAAPQASKERVNSLTKLYASLAFFTRDFTRSARRAHFDAYEAIIDTLEPAEKALFKDNIHKFNLWLSHNKEGHLAETPIERFLEEMTLSIGEEHGNT